MRLHLRVAACGRMPDRRQDAHGHVSEDAGRTGAADGRPHFQFRQQFPLALRDGREALGPGDDLDAAVAALVAALSEFADEKIVGHHLGGFVGGGQQARAARHFQSDVIRQERD
jgi:hypothetical protein